MPRHAPARAGCSSPFSAEARPNMQRTALPVVVISAATLGGCQGVLDPRGPIAAAERLLLINSTAIMLVVVIPVILATLSFAWWYRSSNPRASRASDESFEGASGLF